MTQAAAIAATILLMAPSYYPLAEFRRGGLRKNRGTSLRGSLEAIFPTGKASAAAHHLRDCSRNCSCLACSSGVSIPNFLQKTLRKEFNIAPSLKNATAPPGGAWL